MSYLQRTSVDKCYASTFEKRWRVDGVIHGPRYIGAGCSIYTTICGLKVSDLSRVEAGAPITCLGCLGGYE